ncbi:MAG: hypothetical protein HY986_10810 [Candidatus Melainabacteria bacterium]|nr:hypothetical protein [Candidatus Melainabacteria bacterium]
MLSELERLFLSGEIVYHAGRQDASAGSCGLRSAVVKGSADDSQPLSVRVLVRTAKEPRCSHELTGYRLHRIGPFDTCFPVTVLRADGLLVQERIGKAVFDRAHLLDLRNKGRDAVKPLHMWRDRHINESSSFQYYLENNSVFQDQMEQAHVERIIWGSFDSRASNFAVRVSSGQPRVAVIDLGKAFPVERQLPPPKIRYFKGLALKPSTLKKIAAYAEVLGTESLSAEAVESLSPAQMAAMNYRLDWLLKYKRLPPVEFASAA